MAGYDGKSCSTIALAVLPSLWFTQQASSRSEANAKYKFPGPPEGLRQAPGHLPHRRGSDRRWANGQDVGTRVLRPARGPRHGDLQQEDAHRWNLPQEGPEAQAALQNLQHLGRRSK